MICALGFVRAVIAVVMDVVLEIHFTEILVDSSLLVVLFVLTYLSLQQKIQRIGIAFGFLLSLLLAVNFLQFGGASGYTKFNYYVGLYAITMIYNRRQLVLTLTFHLGLLLVILLLDHYDHPISQAFYINSGPQINDFWFTIGIISVFAYHLKRLTDIFSQKLSSLNIDMAERVREGRTLSRLLQEKNDELKKAQQYLESEVNRRSEVYNKKNQSIENFLKANTSDLVAPVQELISLAEDLEVEHASPLFGLIRTSAGNMEKVSNSIREAILSDQPINRKTISREKHTA